MVLSQVFDLTINNNIFKLLYMIGGFSPTIASYLSLKKNRIIKDFRVHAKIKVTTFIIW